LIFIGKVKLRHYALKAFLSQGFSIIVIPLKRDLIIVGPL